MIKKLLIFKIKINFGVMLGHYIKPRGTRATKMSSNAALITMETYVQQGKQFENQFFIYGPKCRIRKQSEKNFLSLNQKYEQIYTFCHILGVLGGPYVEPR